MAVKEKNQDDDISRVYTPFGVMVGDAGALKSFDDQTFYDEVLEPSEKAQYKKFKEDFIKDPDAQKVKSGFIPWKSLPIKSNARNRLVFDRICSNTWALNKDAIPGFVDLIEKLRQKYSTVIGDDKLLEHLEAAQHRARELEVSTDVPDTSPADAKVKSKADLDVFYKSRVSSSNKIFSGMHFDRFPKLYEPTYAYVHKAISDETLMGIIYTFASTRKDQYKAIMGMLDELNRNIGDYNGSYLDPDTSPDLVRAKAFLNALNKAGGNWEKIPDSFLDNPFAKDWRNQIAASKGVKSSVSINDFGIPIQNDRWSNEPSTYIDDVPVWIEEGFYNDSFGRHEGYNISYEVPGKDWVNKISLPIDSSMEDIQDAVRSALSSNFKGFVKSDSGLSPQQNASLVDPQAVEQYVQGLVQTGVPEDQARQMADQLSKQIQENTAQFVQNVQQTESQKQTGLAASFRIINSSLNNGGMKMNRKSIMSGDITITHEEDDDNLEGNEDFDLGTDGTEDDPLDFGSPSEDGEANLDDGFMDEVNSLDEFGSNSPELSKEEVVDAVQAIDQIIDVILATEGLTEGETPTSEEVSFVLDEVQDLAAGFDATEGTDDLGGDVPGLDAPATDSMGEFDEAGFDENLDEEFPEEVTASLVRVMKAGKSVQSKFRRPFISSEKISGVPALICQGVHVEVTFEEEDEPASDAIVETAVIAGDDFDNETPIESKYARVGSFKKWVKQSKNHKLAWKIASAKYRKLVGQSAKSPRDKAVVYAMANHVYSKYLKNSKSKLFKLFSNKSIRAIRRVGKALMNRFISHKPMKVIHSDYNGYKNYETWNAALWINNDEGIYNIARRCANYSSFLNKIKELGSNATGDGVAWDDENIDRDEMDEVLINCSYKGKGMKRIKSNTQVDGGDELITVQDDTDTGLDLSNETLSDSAIEDPNTERVLRVDGGDTAEIVDVDNTGNEGSLEADETAGTENVESEYGFESQEMVGVELPIEEEDKTQVLELKHIGSGVYVLNRSFVSPGCGRISFVKGDEAAKVLRNNTKPYPVKANTNRVLSLKNSNRGVILRSSPILGVIAVEAPYTKGLKNAKYSVFCRSGLNMVNDEGYFVKLPKGPSKIIASAVSLKSRKGKETKDIFASVEGAYIKYLQGKVTELVKANFDLQTRLNKAIMSQKKQGVLASQFLNKERDFAKRQIASAMQSLDSIKKQTAEIETQRIVSASQNALHQSAMNDKAMQEKNVDTLVKLMGW